jgi:dipeptidyl aminopeptidase/acylaminoacyl peptidase
MANLKLKSVIAVICLFFLHPSCSQKNNSAQKELVVPFKAFNNIITPRGLILPLPGGDKSLIAMKMPGDLYNKIYSLDHNKKQFNLKFDFSRNIYGLVRDYTFKNYYFYADDGGNELSKIYSYDPAANEAQLTFGFDRAGAFIMDFSRSGKLLYIFSNHETGKGFRLYKFDILTRSTTPLTPANKSFREGIVSSDDKYAVLTEWAGNNEKHIYILNLKTLKLEMIASKTGTIYSPTFFSKDENSIYIDTNDDSDRMGCAFITTRAKKLSWIKRDPSRDISCQYVESADFTAVYESFDGRIKTSLYRSIFGPPIEVPFRDRTITNQLMIVPGSTLLVAQIVSSSSPGDFYIFDLDDKAPKKLTKISQINLSGIPDNEFADSYDFYYETSDGLRIHSVYFAKAPWLKDGSRHPVIVWPHGGPDSHQGHSYHIFFQFAALNGYITFAPNFRGSFGYGKKFERLNDGDWGGAEVKDIVFSTREFKKLPFVDPERIYIAGISYGAYATLSAITQFKDEFRAAAAISPISNLFDFMRNMPGDPERVSEFLKEIGDPGAQKQFFIDRSPFFHAENVKIPLIIFQAENDIRTTKSETDNFVERLKTLKIPVRYEILKNDGHALSRTESKERIFEETLKFFNAN